MRPAAQLFAFWQRKAFVSGSREHRAYDFFFFTFDHVRVYGISLNLPRQSYTKPCKQPSAPSPFSDNQTITSPLRMFVLNIYYPLCFSVNQGAFTQFLLRVGHCGGSWVETPASLSLRGVRGFRRLVPHLKEALASSQNDCSSGESAFCRCVASRGILRQTRRSRGQRWRTE